ncbi:hypothetical protein QFC21_003490 [Naganishia friedmannii]|uniref:Uncharacterized protein n=1 Tax=Naganishia friedmannii TaxID=89922 RepID=A0ACC2VQ60_9TREE|nr:hypothetical protein QFC21_003490 [Naganishia friedmannii]
MQDKPSDNEHDNQVPTKTVSNAEEDDTSAATPQSRGSYDDAPGGVEAENQTDLEEEMTELGADSKKFFCLLGMASSTASVERLFSHAGHVLGRKRWSLSAKLLSKQVMLRMWDLMGLLTGDELVAAETEEEDEAEE